MTNFSSHEKIFLNENLSFLAWTARAQSFNCLAVIGSRYGSISFDKYPTSFNCSKVLLKILTTNIISIFRFGWNVATNAYETR